VKNFPATLFDGGRTAIILPQFRIMRGVFNCQRMLAAIPFSCINLLIAHQASADTVAFVLNDITYSNTSSIYGVTKGNGLIAWTYNVGDFQNGTGKFVFVNLPPYTVYPSPSYGPVYTVDASMTTGTITQNVDTYWYDFTINYSPALSGPNSTASITSGNYDLYGSNPSIGYSGNFLGQIIGGTVTPYRPSLSIQRSGTNIVVTWPTNYADGFALESAASLTSASAWTTSATPAIVSGTNYVVTKGSTGNASLFVRLIR
jgi:hypothetical protein